MSELIHQACYNVKIVRFANEMKPGVNPVWKIVLNNMHVFVIDFVLVPI